MKSEKKNFQRGERIPTKNSRRNLLPIGKCLLLNPCPTDFLTGNSVGNTVGIRRTPSDNFL